MKYRVKMSCGHEEDVYLLGSGKEREQKIAYYEKYGFCKECYKEKMKQIEKEEGLKFHVSALPHIDIKTGSILLFVWFEGDTKPNKDRIKALGGYSWCERESSDDWYSLSRPKMCWGKVIEEARLQEEAEKAASIGAKSMVPDGGLFALPHYHIAAGLQTEWKARKAALEAIPKPAVPDVLLGHKWNQKIYGKEGNLSIYLEGNKVPITDEQAEELKEYRKSSEEYKKKVKEIENAQES